MINSKGNSVKGNTALNKPSKFKTIVIDAVNDDNPQEKIINTIATHEIEDCVVKVIYSVTSEQVPMVNTSKVKNKLSKASFANITPVVIQNPSKTFLPEIDASLYDSPLVAFDKYLNSKPELNKTELMKKAELLVKELALKGR